MISVSIVLATTLGIIAWSLVSTILAHVRLKADLEEIKSLLLIDLKVINSELRKENKK